MAVSKSKKSASTSSPKPSSKLRGEAAVVTAPKLDPGAAQKAYAQLKDAFAKLPAGSIVRVNLDPAQAASAALQLVARANVTATRKRLATLPAELFDIGVIEQLQTAALGLFYTSTKTSTARALASRAKLPADLVKRASSLEKRMLRLATYHFEDDVAVAPVLAEIRRDKGYAALSHDLDRLAEIYDGHLGVVKTDAKYIAGDEKTAHATAQEILSALGLSPNDGWSANEARAFTLVTAGYEELASTIAWVERKDPDATPVPSLQHAADPERGAKTRETKKANAKKKAGAPPASTQSKVG